VGAVSSQMSLAAIPGCAGRFGRRRRWHEPEGNNRAGIVIGSGDPVSVETNEHLWCDGNLIGGRLNAAVGLFRRCCGAGFARRRGSAVGRDWETGRRSFRGKRGQHGPTRSRRFLEAKRRQTALAEIARLRRGHGSQGREQRCQSRKSSHHCVSNKSAESPRCLSQSLRKRPTGAPPAVLELPTDRPIRTTHQKAFQINLDPPARRTLGVIDSAG